jgi:MFS family permease
MAATMDAQERKSLNKVIIASSAGTLIEWYDFYIFGALATILTTQFFPPGEGIGALLKTFGIFAVGFVVRPFGALVFGRMGDLVGRKVTFLLTLLMMGGATFAIGLVPSYAQIGMLAPILLLVLRTLQGLALGGEYGGAATYVAEHAPVGKRGYYTSFIQITATLGLVVSLAVILITRKALGEEAFAEWGWRIPFLLSMVLVVLSYFIRRSMHESPLFARLKASGKTSTNPLRESFVNPANRRLVLLALFGVTAGQGVVWYTGQFYAMYFITQVLKVEEATTNIIVAAALLLVTPFFIVFAALSDRIGRKRLMLAGCLLGAVLWVPIYSAKLSMNQDAALKSTQALLPVAAPDSAQVVKVENKLPDGTIVYAKQKYKADASGTIVPDGKPSGYFHPTTSVAIALGVLVFLQALFVTMIYGPVAAFLVELFPTRIRYTSMSLPYHIGNGVFGGLVPLVSTWLVDRTGNKLAGLGYPIAIAVITLIIGAALVPEPDPHASVTEDADA